MEKTAEDALLESLRFAPQDYVERGDEAQIVEKLLERLKNQPVVMLRGDRGAGKSWFLLYLIARAMDANPPSPLSDVKTSSGTEQAKRAYQNWTRFLKEHRVMVLLCESLPIAEEFLNQIHSIPLCTDQGSEPPSHDVGNIVLFTPVHQAQPGRRLSEEDITMCLAEQVRKALGIAAAIPLPREEETQFQMVYRNVLQEQPQKPLFIVDSIDMLDASAREALVRLYLNPVLDVGGRVLCTLRSGSQPSFKRRAFSDAPSIELPSLSDHAWEVWIKRWIARRVGETPLTDDEQVWRCLTELTQGSPLLVALAWECARSRDGVLDLPPSTWGRLQQQARRDCRALQRCMARTWIRLTFAAHRKEDDRLVIPLPSHGEAVILDVDALQNILSSLCQVYVQEKPFDLWQWEPPALGEHLAIDRWDVVHLLNMHGLLTWKSEGARMGWVLDDTVRRLFCPISDEVAAVEPAPSSERSKVDGGVQ